MARALGVRQLTSSCTVTSVPRVDHYASRAKIRVGLHNHSRLRPNELASPESFQKALDGRSPYIGITLDIGHFTASGFDPVEFLERHHNHIFELHIKDRKKNDGPNVPFGEGDTPIKQVLQLMQAKHYSMPANIEKEYQTADNVAAVRRCLDYCLEALGAQGSGSKT
jgi:sugar phosphate isomerase/epimerase